jgi:hypothetical protein
MQKDKDKLDDIYNLILELTQKVNNIEKKLNILLDKNNDIENACSKMNGHIEFVEDTYTNVRAPLNYLKNKIEYMMGRNNDKELPAIKDKDKYKDKDKDKDNNSDDFEEINYNLDDSDNE